jgi:uncharacterized protein (DUF58 family)
VTVEIPIYQLFCGLLGLLAISETLGLLFKPTFELKGSPPSRSMAGESVTAEFIVRNRSRWRPAYDVMLGVFGLPASVRHADGDQFLSRIAAGRDAKMPLTLSTLRRGIFPLPAVHAVSTFPFHLMRFGGARTEPGRLVVLPNYHSLEEVEIPVSHRYQPGGVTITKGVGHSPEFVGNREYVPGEPARRIDSKGWARTGKPVVKEYHEEYLCRVALVLDTHLPHRRAGHAQGMARLEAAVSLMAAIAEQLNFHEHVVDLFAAGPDLYVFRTLGGTTRFESVLEILAGVDACRRNPFEQISPLLVEELETISTAVCVFVDWDSTRAQFVQRVLESGCTFKGILIRNQEEEPFGPVEMEGPAEWRRVTVEEITQGHVNRL